MLRLIALSDGSGMGGSLCIFKTDAPKSRLKELEKETQSLIDFGGDPDELIWSDILYNEGYIFDYVDECRHMTPYGTSGEWLDRKYPNITEIYYIDY